MHAVSNLVRWAALLAVAALLLACEPVSEQKSLQYSKEPAASGPPVYRFAVHPLYNPQMLSAAYQPLVDHLNAQLPNIRVELESSRDYQAFESKYTERQPEFLLPNPWQTLQAMKAGYHVIAMAGDAQDFKGIFIVRRDSGIKTPADLKGKVVCYPSHTALAAAIMPQFFLHSNGINVTRDIQNVYVGSQESSILNVHLGLAAAGATWPPPWRLFQKDHPKEAADLQVIWETESLVNNSVMVRDDVPQEVREKVKTTLVNLAQQPGGSAILEGMSTARFHPADDGSYGVVAKYVEHFEQVVRPVRSP
jgi:phosphonate transport system substrate-binding protein